MKYFCPRTKVFRKFLSHPNKICPTQKFSGKDEIRAKASFVSQTTLSSLSIWLLGREEKVAKRKKVVWITIQYFDCMHKCMMPMHWPVKLD